MVTCLIKTSNKKTFPNWKGFFLPFIYLDDRMIRTTRI